MPARPWDADEAVTPLYAGQYRALVRLAALLLRDVGAAEEVVQDSFVAMHGSWRRLRDPDRALAYLRQSVVNRSRSALRHRTVVARHAPAPLPDAASAEHGALEALERGRSSWRAAPAAHPPARGARAALLQSTCPRRDRRRVGISRGRSRATLSRGLAALKVALAAHQVADDDHDTDLNTEGSR